MAGTFRLARVVPVGAALLAIAACGGSSTGGSTTSSSAASSSSSAAGGGGSGSHDACFLLTQSGAAQVSGDSNISQLSAGSSSAVCIYLDQTNGSGATLYVQQLPNGTDQALVQQAIKHAGGSGANSQQISGIGDAAYKEVESTSATVAFVKGNTLVAIYASSQSQTGANLETNLENLARQVVTSL